MKQIYDFEQKTPPVLTEDILRTKKKASMKKRLSVIIMLMLTVGIITYFPAKQILGKSDVMLEWGKILSGQTPDEANSEEKYSDTKYRLSTKGISSKNIISGEEVFKAGSDILITKQELEKVKSFYLLQGQSDKEAEESAVKYTEEYNAMYIEAINNGFDVTEEEINQYISDLKTMLYEAGNADDAKKVIAQFDSEEEYWEYERIVYQKQLPIQKYVETLEDEELEKVKEAAVKKQKFKKIDDVEDIDKKFKVEN